MIFSKCIMILMTIFFILGALDRLIGNKFGLGGEFERAFGLMRPTALSVIGLIVLAPVLAGFLQEIIAPVFRLIGGHRMFPGCSCQARISYPYGGNGIKSNRWLLSAAL